MPGRGKLAADARRRSASRASEESSGGWALALSSNVYACGITVVATDAADAGAFVERIAAHADKCATEFVLVFFSKVLFEAAELVGSFAARAPGLRYGGCSTAGEITPDGLTEGSAVAILFPS